MNTSAVARVLASAVALVVACALPPAACAAPPTNESIESLLEVTHVERILDTMYAGIESSMRQGMQAAQGDAPLTDEQRRLFAILPTRLANFVRAQMNWQTMKPGYVALYRDTLDQDDVDAMLAFYRSPAGQRVLDKQPLLTERAMALGQSQMTALMPKLRAEMQSALREAGVVK